MAFNPFKEKGTPPEEQFKSWEQMNVQPYDKNQVHPYTRCRIITINGALFEGVWFGHQHARHCTDLDTKRKSAMMRRLVQMQQKIVGGLIPADESVLENTIGYEQVAVDLTAWLARHEPDPHVKAALDFALLEDFDHLYRYANLLEMTEGIKAEKLVGEYTEIMPGRPTAEEHRHPFDDVREHFDAKSADVRTKINAQIIVAGEQQTMNFYMNVANRADTKVGRGLYAEIAMIEEQHVTHYESLLDPTMSWEMRAVMHHYTDAFLFWSFAQTEVDERIKKIWEAGLESSIGMLQATREMVKAAEDKDPADELGEFPHDPMTYEANVDYVRKIEAEQVEWTCDGTEYKPKSELPDDHRYFRHQKTVNEGGAPSEKVIDQHLEEFGEEYRMQLSGEHPVQRLQERRSAA